MKLVGLSLLALYLPCWSFAQLSVHQILDSSAKYYASVEQADVHYLYANKNLLKSVIDTQHHYFQYVNSGGARQGIRRFAESPNYDFFIDNAAYFVDVGNKTYMVRNEKSDDILEDIPHWNGIFFKNLKNRINSSAKVTASDPGEYKISFTDKAFWYVLVIDKSNFSVKKYSETTFDKKYGMQLQEWVFPAFAHFNAPLPVIDAIDSTKKTFTLTKYSSKSSDKANSIIKKAIIDSKVDLSETFYNHPNLRSKYILLDFFHQACLPCIKSIPDLNSLSKDFDSSELTIFAIDPFLEDVKSTPSFIKRYNVGYQIIDGDYAIHVKNTVLKNYHIGYPTYVLISRDGTVIEIIEGYSKKHFKYFRETFERK